MKQLGSRVCTWVMLCAPSAQLFGAMDWAPSDLVAAFLLAGALQNARRRAAVYAVLGDDPDADVAAGGDGAAAHAGAPGPERPCQALGLPWQTRRNCGLLT